MVEIKSLSEYLFLRPQSAFLDPLLLLEIFIINRDLRREIIAYLFEKQSPENDSKYYRWMWEMKPHWCENCGKPLKNYWAGYVSHILSRGAHTELRYDPLNSNILCYECHQIWETGKRWKKEAMYIYPINMKIIQYLTNGT